MSSIDDIDNIYRVVFLTRPPPPNFSTKKKIAKQPITAFLSYRIFWNYSCGWLIGSFLFATEIRGGQLKKPPCMSRILMQTSFPATCTSRQMLLLPGLNTKQIVVEKYHGKM